jgi:hypothetical protein
MTQVPLGQSIGVHVNFMDPPPTDEPIEVSVSNPGVADVSEDPAHPGDSGWRLVTPQTPGKFVIGVTGGSFRTSLPEMEVVVEEGAVAAIEPQEIVLG